MSAPLDAVQALGLHQNSPAETGSGFDNHQLAEADAKFAAGIANRIRFQLRASIIATGDNLEQVKARLGHGLFGPWLKAEFNMEERTARNYMSAARLAARKSETVADLPPAALYALASPSTPEAAQDAIVQRLKAGERIEAPVVREVIREAKAAVREAKKSPEQREREARERGAAAKKERRSRAAREQEQAAFEEGRRQAKSGRIADASPAARLLVEALGERLSEFQRLMRAEERSAYFPDQHQLFPKAISSSDLFEAAELVERERVASGRALPPQAEFGSYESWHAEMMRRLASAPEAVREQFLRSVRANADQVPQ